MSTKNKKVYVGLSGGVDSSVSAYLLKKEGHDVTGVFIRVWHPEFLECDWKNDRRDAMRVCAELGIPFKELDLETEYKEHVVDYMIREYKAGRTPNPDIMCNQHVKFGAFLSWARAQGADMIATGHYARLRRETQSQSLNTSQDQNSNNETIQLLKGLDDNKDQTYFLWTLGQDQLRHTLFPVGHLEKSEVRTLAEKAGLLTATKKDSQGICFIGHVDLKDFLKRFIDDTPGDVLDLDGKIIGHHEGATFYTLGQRHGYTITEKGTDDKPYYIVKKDIAHNTITVSMDKTETSHATHALALSQVNWVEGRVPDMTKEYQARFRYRQHPLSCRIEEKGNSIVIRFDEPQHHVSAGQSCVLYDGERCVGGGIIEDADI